MFSKSKGRYLSRPDKSLVACYDTTYIYHSQLSSKALYGSSKCGVWERRVLQIGLSHDNPIKRSLSDRASAGFGSSRTRVAKSVQSFIVSHRVHQTLLSTNAPPPTCFLGLSWMNIPQSQDTRDRMSTRGIQGAMDVRVEQALLEWVCWTIQYHAYLCYG